MINVSKIPEVVKRSKRSKSTIYSEIPRGLFPPPVKIGRTSVWPDDEIEELLRLYVRGASEDEIRSCVAAMLARRRLLGEPDQHR